MWHEARRQERKIRGMLVDYQRRAERRRDFYETIKADPTQFLQIHGRQCKIHLDPAVAIAGDSPTNMMPWQNNQDNMIDRFDVRAHLDFIPETVVPKTPPEVSLEERQCNYESYRILAQNIFLGIGEEKFLQQLHLEEQLGGSAYEAPPKKKKTGGAAIAFNYDDPTASVSTPQPPPPQPDPEEDSDSDIDIDVDVSIDITKVGMTQAHEMNTFAQSFGMEGNDYYSFLTRDADEADSLRLAREEEQEKALYSGRKSRRERRAHKERRLQDQRVTTFSFALEQLPSENVKTRSVSKSPSPAPASAGEIQYITSFGGEEEAQSSAALGGSRKKVTKQDTKASYADKLKHSLDKRSPSPKRHSNKSRRRSSSRSRSRSRYRRSSSRHRRYSKSKSRSRSKAGRSGSQNLSSKSHNYRSRSLSKSRTHSRNQRSRSRSKDRSRSRSRVRRSHSHSNSLSPSDAVLKERTTEQIKQPVQVKKYYGRKRNEESSSELSASSAAESDMDTAEATTETSATSHVDASMFGKTKANASAASKPSCGNVNLQERLKKKMQVLLARTLKEDKKAEILRDKRVKQQQYERDEQMREMAIKIRRRQRALRHQSSACSSSSSSAESDGDGSNHSEPSKSKDKGDAESSIICDTKTSDHRSGHRDIDKESDISSGHTRKESEKLQEHARHSTDRYKSSKGYKSNRSNDDRPADRTNRTESGGPANDTSRRYDRRKDSDNHLNTSNERRSNRSYDGKDSKIKPLVDY